MNRCKVRVTLRVSYPDGYPDTLPTLSLDSDEGTLTDYEVSKLLSELNSVVRSSSHCPPARGSRLS